jgi:hypothetical protein
VKIHHPLRPPPADKLETLRHREVKCGVYFRHGNTAAKTNATLLGGAVEEEERFCPLFHLLLLLE